MFFDPFIRIHPETLNLTIQKKNLKMKKIREKTFLLKTFLPVKFKVENFILWKFLIELS